MKELSFIYDMVFDTNCDVIDTRNALEAAICINPDRRDAQHDRVHSLMRLAAGALERIEAELDSACDQIAKTESKLDKAALEAAQATQAAPTDSKAGILLANCPEIATLSEAELARLIYEAQRYIRTKATG